MSNMSDQNNFFQELEKLEISLNRLLSSIININEFLVPLEHSLRSDDFSSSGLLVPGTSNGIVCILSSLIQGDPLFNSIASIRGSGRNFPSILKGSDRTESKSTCDTILKILEGKTRSSPISYVINLRWANLPSTLDSSKTIVIGKRYYHVQEDAMKKLSNHLTNRGFDVLEDDGEFGGGPLIFQLVNLAQQLGNITVLEITLHRQIAENLNRIFDVLESLTIL